MRYRDSERLRREWREKGNPKCDHPVLVLERTDEEDLTGKHVCTTCGTLLACTVLP